MNTSLWFVKQISGDVIQLSNLNREVIEFPIDQISYYRNINGQIISQFSLLTIIAPKKPTKQQKKKKLSL